LERLRWTSSALGALRVTRRWLCGAVVVACFLLSPAIPIVGALGTTDAGEAHACGCGAGRCGTSCCCTSGAAKQEPLPEREVRAGCERPDQAPGPTNADAPRVLAARVEIRRPDVVDVSPPVTGCGSARMERRPPPDPPPDPALAS